MWASRVLIEHQPHHGWYSFVLTHPTTTTFALLTSICPQIHPTTWKRAPPLSWGMWAQIQKLQLVWNRQPCCICPSSFQRNVGGTSSLDGRTGEGKTQGGTQGIGGPFGASPQRTTMKIMVRFFPSISPQPALTILSPPRSTHHPCCHCKSLHQ